MSSLVETKYRSMVEIDDTLGLGLPDMPSLKDVMRKETASSTPTDVGS